MAPSGLINGRTGTTTQAFSEPVLLCGLWGPLVHCMIRAGSASGLPGSASPEPSQKQRRWYRDDAVTGGIQIQTFKGSIWGEVESPRRQQKRVPGASKSVCPPLPSQHNAATLNKPNTCFSLPAPLINGHFKK